MNAIKRGEPNVIRQMPKAIDASARTPGIANMSIAPMFVDSISRKYVRTIQNTLPARAPIIDVSASVEMIFFREATRSWFRLD